MIRRLAAHGEEQEPPESRTRLDAKLQSPNRLFNVVTFVKRAINLTITYLCRPHFFFTMAGFWSVIYEPLNKKILNYRSYKYATFNCLSKCLTLKPIFLPLSFNRDPNSSKSCYSRHRTLWFEIKGKGFNQLGLHWYVFHWDFVVPMKQKERNPKDGHLKKGDPRELFSTRRDHGENMKVDREKRKKINPCDLSLTYPNW